MLPEGAAAAAGPISSVYRVQQRGCDTTAECSERAFSGQAPSRPMLCVGVQARIVRNFMRVLPRSAEAKVTCRQPRAAPLDEYLASSRQGGRGEIHR